ncbi:pyrroline-5-carboxylate reductase [Mesobacillus campisalis]|uniref:Pyrroline-5-carboxylate reductase n=1 Tax=Mesobacillus campisalis TaxID=1408103 RepID=A0A0M2SG62_9BACI|nr:pyrroline-5-carboxylate reductase [Mesobacillus campisalis]KKK33273.1 pyrroline-5-carboxylate reductase [Mesobacillus campisalis]
MKKLVFFGAGSMAEALMSGIIENGLLKGSQIWVTNRNNQKKLKQLEQTYGINGSYDYNELFADADAVILAMKPKDAAGAINEFKSFLRDDILLISVLAGVSLETMEQAAEKPLAIIRAMPNTSAAVSRSATAIAGNQRVTEAQKRIAQKLFDTVGFTAFVQEEQLDAVTGLSGSGPAYIYYLVEAMEKSAVEIGLEQKLAKDLIVQTLIGAAAMMATSEKTPEELRLQVTSPGGTTEAGIAILEKHGVQEAFISCIKEAANHSRKMGEALSSELGSGKQPIKLSE